MAKSIMKHDVSDGEARIQSCLFWCSVPTNAVPYVIALSPSAPRRDHNLQLSRALLLVDSSLLGSRASENTAVNG